MQVIGRLEEVMPLEQKSQTFQVRRFVLEIAQPNSQYTEHVQFQVTNARTTILDQFQVGQEVIVDFDLRGRKWTSPEGKVSFFNSLDAWKITPYASQHPGTAAQQPAAQNPSGFNSMQQSAQWGGFQQPAPAMMQQPPMAGAMGNNQEIPF